MDWSVRVSEEDEKRGSKILRDQSIFPRNSLYLFVVIFKEFFFFLNCHERNINKVVQNGFVTRYVLCIGIDNTLISVRGNIFMRVLVVDLYP